MPTVPTMPTMTSFGYPPKTTEDEPAENSVSEVSELSSEVAAEEVVVDAMEEVVKPYDEVQFDVPSVTVPIMGVDVDLD